MNLPENQRDFSENSSQLDGFIDDEVCEASKVLDSLADSVQRDENPANICPQHEGGSIETDKKASGRISEMKKNRTLSREAIRKFIDLPNEVIIQIFQWLPSGGPELSTIRLLNKSFAELAKPAFFHAVTLVENLDHLENVTGFLAKQDIACHIRKLKLSMMTLLPQDIFEDPSNYIKPDDDTIVPLWVSRFAISILKLFGACHNIQILRLYGYMADSVCPYTDAAQDFNKIFFGCLVEILCSVRLPKLYELRFELHELAHLSGFWALHNINCAGTLKKNLSNVRSITFTNPHESEAQTQDSMDSFVRWSADLDLKELTLEPDMGSTSPLRIGPLRRNMSLTSLDLDKIFLRDSLRKVLDGMRLLSIRLTWVSIFKYHDRWEQVFDALNKMPDLKPQELCGLFYNDVEHGDCDGLCTPFEADKRAFLKFADKHREYKRDGSINKFGRCGWLCKCVDKL